MSNQMENTKCQALVELLNSHRDQLAAVNVARLYGWGNSRVLRLLSALQKAGLIEPITNRPGEYTANVEALVGGLPQNIVELVTDVMFNDKIGTSYE
ncbi:hypothetical protein [Leclercia adecarboxylata]|uniref:hypothetical protein n=1 Tax=Leclercia adecarboxylata TaxID=83655 RepID=UPI0013CF4AFD|nr:hypothetical protein [Leclercia adecarboxylata]